MAVGYHNEPSSVTDPYAWPGASMDLQLSPEQSKVLADMWRKGAEQHVTRFPELSVNQQRLKDMYERAEKEAEVKKVAQSIEDIIRERQQEKEVARRLAWIEEQGDDNRADGAILTFRKKKDTFVSIKKDQYWYTISDGGFAKRYCWADFLLFLSEANPTPTLTELKQVVVEVPTN